MKQRVLIMVQAVFTSLIVFASCSKSNNMAEQMPGPKNDPVKTLAPGPMPADSLELDSLRTPLFQ